MQSDSSDDEDLNIITDAPPLNIKSLPSFSKDDAVVQRKLENAKKNPASFEMVVCRLVC